jgi:uncharacterized glyoxalase superfamily protein PhnB
MTQLNAYLRFYGNCREAMTFYQACLGGELWLQTFGESPMAGEMPPAMKDNVLHSSLTKDSLVLMETPFLCVWLGAAKQKLNQPLQSFLREETLVTP